MTEAKLLLSEYILWAIDTDNAKGETVFTKANINILIKYETKYKFANGLHKLVFVILNVFIIAALSLQQCTNRS